MTVLIAAVTKTNYNPKLRSMWWSQKKHLLLRKTVMIARLTLKLVLLMKRLLIYFRKNFCPKNTEKLTLRGSLRPSLHMV